MSLGAAYNRLWTATALSNLGDGIRSAALPLLAASMSADPVVVAGVAVAGQLPWLLLGLIAGALVDRFDQRRLVVLVDCGRTALLAALTVGVLTGSATVAWIYAVAFACGLGETLRDTATATLLPPLVNDADLERANGRLVNAEVAGNELIGPPLGGYLFGVAMVLPIAVNGGTLALAAALIFSLPGVFAPAPGPALAAKGRIRHETVAGLRWLVRSRRMFTLSLLSGTFAFVDSMWFVVLVLFVQQILALPAAIYGLLVGVGAVGGLIGGFLAARVVRLLGPAPALTACLLTAAGGQLMLGLATEAVLVALGLAATSAAFGVWSVVARTQRQRGTPRDLLGRVTSASTTVVMTASPLGALVGGLIGREYGLRAAILLGVPALVVAACVAYAVLREPAP
ncbi:MFS transporter [Nonomuraea antri]|uniref:MFS transporter n=1 Tax=Nonomuraea antri TaxID=2730852 RepID=UPI001F44602E|nr:MFS transporter [Nonomuraea antri]